MPGPQATYCSRRCMRKGYRKWGKIGKGKTPRPPVDPTCEHCGKGFWRRGMSSHPRDAARFCSRECAFAYAGFAKIARLATIALTRIQKRKDRALAKEDEARARLLEDHNRRTKACAACGAPFLQRNTISTCSDKCRAEQLRQSRRRALRKRRALGKDDRGKARKRARRHGVAYEFISRRYVMERDGWTCGICGGSIPKKAVVPHPNAGVLDHIVPISKGGPHLKHNVHAAHFACNNLKRDGSVGEQLLLIG